MTGTDLPTLAHEALVLLPLTADEIASTLQVARADVDRWWRDATVMTAGHRFSIAFLLERAAPAASDPSRASAIATALSDATAAAFERDQAAAMSKWFAQVAAGTLSTTEMAAQLRAWQVAQLGPTWSRLLTDLATAHPLPTSTNEQR